MVCTVSSDSTVRAWDVQEVSWVGGQGAAHGILVRSFPSLAGQPPWAASRWRDPRGTDEKCWLRLELWSACRRSLACP